MNARYYVPSLGRFASADTLVPDPSNPQQFNRFSYTLNNPIRLTDPSGHCSGSALDENGQPNKDDCWRFVWWIWDDWARNGLWQSYYGDLDTFWTLAHDELLDGDYWRFMYNAAYGKHVSEGSVFSGLSSDHGSPISRERPWPRDGVDYFLISGSFVFFVGGEMGIIIDKNLNVSRWCGFCG